MADAATSVGGPGVLAVLLVSACKLSPVGSRRRLAGNSSTQPRVAASDCVLVGGRSVRVESELKHGGGKWGKDSGLDGVWVEGGLTQP